MTVDLTIDDVILFLLWCDKDNPVFGKSKLIKEVSAFRNELMKRGYKVEELPDEKFIITTAEDLYFAGYIIIAVVGQRHHVYMLSKKGIEEVDYIVKEKIREEDIEYFKQKRRSLDNSKMR